MATTVNKNRVSASIRRLSGVACLLLAVNTAPVASMPAECELTIAKTCYGPDDTSPIEFTFKNECIKPKKKDWIAIFPADEEQDDFEYEYEELWTYLCGSQKKCKKKEKSGTVSIADWITNDQTPSGEYKAYLFKENKYTIKAETGVFTISKTEPCSGGTAAPTQPPTLAPPPCEDQSGKFVLKPKKVGKKGKKRVCKWAKNPKNCNKALEDGGKVKDVCPKKCNNCPTQDDKDIDGPTPPPTKTPTGTPSAAPTESLAPSAAPTESLAPSVAPSVYPSASPTISASPAASPTISPFPSAAPSDSASPTTENTSPSTISETWSGTTTSTTEVDIV